MRIQKILSVFCALILGLTVSYSAMADTANDNTINGTVNASANPEIFAKQVALALFNYNYQNYDVKLANAKNYFTGIGWQAYKAALTESNNIDTMKKMSLTMTGEVTGPIQLSQPTDTNDTINNIIVAKFPVTVIYKNADGESKQVLNVTMNIINASKQWKVEQFFSKPQA